MRESNRYYRIEIPAGARVIARLSNVCFSKFLGLRVAPRLLSPPLPRRASPTRNAKRSTTRLVKDPSENISGFQSNRGYDFPLNYIGRVAGDPIDPIDRDLSLARARARRRSEVRAECRERAELRTLLISENATAGGLEK